MIKLVAIAILLCGVQAAKLPCLKDAECVKPLHPLLQWLGGSFAWPCPSTKAIYKSSGRFVPKNVIATRAQILKDEVFVALPRFKPGVPVTLGKTSLKKGCAATFSPFPCWSMQEEGNCQALQSVVDIFLDRQVSNYVFCVSLSIKIILLKKYLHIYMLNVRTIKSNYLNYYLLYFIGNIMGS